jgi:uncharacterized Zn finger protein (UPF0148 family)
MSPSDIAFLKALGIDPEAVAPAAVQWNDRAPVYETCPECGGKRHRYLDDGMVFCLSCTARKKREKERYQLEILRQIALVKSEREKLARTKVNGEFEGREVAYRGFEIARLEGSGWHYRRKDAPCYAEWMKAHSVQDAIRKINRLTIEPLHDEIDAPIVAQNQCRECGSPCGQMKWCGPCGKAKFL